MGREFQGEQPFIRDVIRNIDGEPVVPRTANMLYIPPIKNLTAGKGISEKLMLRLRRSIQADGRLSLVDEEKSADLVLEVAVLKYRIQSIAYERGGNPTRKRIRIVAGTRMVDLNKRKLIFHDNSVQAFYEFSDTVPPITTEQEALFRVLDSLGIRITAKAMSGWYTEHMNIIEKGGR